MVILTRCLDLVAATILEATMMYTMVEFPDLLTVDACFLMFVVVTAHWLWRVSYVGRLILPPAAVWTRKQWRNLDLTLLVESVFSQVCYRKDG